MPFPKDLILLCRGLLLFFFFYPESKFSLFALLFLSEDVWPAEGTAL